MGAVVHLNRIKTSILFKFCETQAQGIQALKSFDQNWTLGMSWLLSFLACFANFGMLFIVWKYNLFGMSTSLKLAEVTQCRCSSKVLIATHLDLLILPHSL